MVAMVAINPASLPMIPMEHIISLVVNRMERPGLPESSRVILTTCMVKNSSNNMDQQANNSSNKAEYTNPQVA